MKKDFKISIDRFRKLQNSRSKLYKNYMVPPFSIFDRKNKEWIKNKKIWLNLGIKSEIGRICNGSNSFNDLSINKRKAESAKKIANVGDGPSIFDPYLCQIIYTWFAIKNKIIIDPFAGGSVRGIVASILDYKYYGCDLRIEQIKSNKKQYKEIIKNYNIKYKPKWYCADSERKIKDFPKSDFIFSCPPYGNLEKYSDLVDDLSNMNYYHFLKKYTKIIELCFDRLNNNRFACFVVSDFRNLKGNYYGFVSDTIKIFKNSGFELYNEIILLSAIGSASLRCSNYFNKSRKVAKIHQNVLVFVKGDSQKATKNIKKYLK